MVCKVLPTYHSSFTFYSFCSSLAKPFLPHQLLSLLIAMAHTETPCSHSPKAVVPGKHQLIFLNAAQVSPPPRGPLLMPSGQEELSLCLHCIPCLFLSQPL